MGGLVIRSACHYGRQARAAWVDYVRHAFYLGSPHVGAPRGRARCLSGMHHFGLLNHPDVWQAMRGLLRQTAR